MGLFFESTGDSGFNREFVKAGKRAGAPTGTSI